MNKDSKVLKVTGTDSAPEEDELRDEYDFSQMKGGVRGKYAERYREGTNVVLLAPDVLKVFPTSDAVNEALRKIMRQNAMQNNVS